jgi:hypothetical protein
VTENTDSANGVEEVSELAQGFPKLSDVFSGILEYPDVQETGVRELQVYCFANGEATFNIQYVDDEEKVGGALTN